MKNLNWVPAASLIFIALAVSALVVYISTTRALTAVESIIWQVFALTAGLAGSFIFGRQSAREAAKEILKPHARGAARYLVSLYKSISRARSVAAVELPQGFESYQHYSVIRAYLTAIFTEQLATADDALENWRDILEEEVEDLIQKLQDNVAIQEEVEALIQKLLPDYEMEDKDDPAN